MLILNGSGDKFLEFRQRERKHSGRFVFRAERGAITLRLRVSLRDKVLWLSMTGSMKRYGFVPKRIYFLTGFSSIFIKAGQFQ